MAEAISRLDDVERCQASLHSRSLTVDFRHSINELNGFMDQAERSFEQLLAEQTKRHDVELHGGMPEPIGDVRGCDRAEASFVSGPGRRHVRDDPGRARRSWDSHRAVLAGHELLPGAVVAVA